MPTPIRLPNDIEHRLDFLVRQTSGIKAFYIRQMILAKIDDMEDYYLAADTPGHARKGDGATFTADEVRKDLGLNDRLGASSIYINLLAKNNQIKLPRFPPGQLERMN